MSADERGLVDVIRETADIDGRVERNPYAMLAGALGAGYVLGGGLFTRLTERLAGAAVRIGLIAAWPMMQEEIGRYIREMAGRSESEEEKGKSP